MSSWIDDFTTVVGGVTEVLTEVRELTQPQTTTPTTPKQAAEETAQPTQVEGSNTLPPSTSPWPYVALAGLALLLLLEVG